MPTQRADAPISAQVHQEFIFVCRSIGDLPDLDRADAAPVAIENLAGSALKQARQQRPAGVVVSVLAGAPLTLGYAGQYLLDVLPAACIGRFTALLTGDTATHDVDAFLEGDAGKAGQL